MQTEDINLPYCLMLLTLSNQFIPLLQSRVIIHSLQFHLTSFILIVFIKIHFSYILYKNLRILTDTDILEL